MPAGKLSGMHIQKIPDYILIKILMALLTKIDISINQKPFKSFREVSISQNLYGIDRFEIRCRYDALEELDGFLIEKSKNFLGLPIVIQTKFLMNNEDKDGINFRGYITEIQSLRSGVTDYDEVIIAGGSTEIALNRKPTNRAFIDNNLEEIVKEVLKKYQLKYKISPRNKERFPYIVQFEESDLEFLKRLSIRYGEWCYFNGQDFIFGEIPPGQKSETLTLGSDLKSLKYELRANPVKFSLFTVDPLKLDVYRYNSGSSKIESNLNMYGKHALKMSKTLYTEEGRDYFEHINVKESDYKKGLDQVGETIESVDAVNLNDLSGISVNGFLNAGTEVKIDCSKQDGKGKIDYGKYIVTAVNHQMDNTLSYENSFTAIPAETSIPENTDPYFVRTSSNQLGMVEDNKDPEKLGRVKISFWWMEGRQTTPWIKITTPYIHKEAGFYFIPAKNSRVLVGFEDGDVEKPYVIGTLFDKDANPDPDWAGNRNESNAKIHAIRTAAGNTIELNDTDGGEKITIYDRGNNNRITLNSAGGKLSVHSTGEAHMTANSMASISLGDPDKPEDSKVSVWLQEDSLWVTNESGDVFVESKNNDLGVIAFSGVISIKGRKIVLEASESLEIKGPVVKINGAATTEIKGGIVQIN
jgi:type VI secretion system secreted protein VgrG